MAYAKTPESVSHLLRSEMESAIIEANLGIENTRIATMYLIEHIPMIEIAVELGFERSTISHRIPYIVQRIEKTAQKMRFT